jgi:superfamily II DNA or RNA helicase
MPSGIYDKIICHVGEHPEFIPQDHQKKVLDYFINKLKYKGLLLFHRLGSGKSCSSIIISDEMIKQSKVKKIFVMTPGSLRQNFIEEYCERCGYSPKTLKKYYTFITTNYSVGERIPNLDNSIVIIDEVHNLINGVKNNSKHSKLIYDKILKSNCKVLALTGTPIYNYIWEWPFLGNLLKPGTFANLYKHGELDTESFMKKFIIDDDGNIKPKNPKQFAVKLRGIISYFPGRGGGYYPKVIHEDPIQVRMTPPQDLKYWEVSFMEQRIRSIGPPKKSLLRTSPKAYHDAMELYIMATKYVLSRHVSNFYYPPKFSSSTEPSNKDEIQHIGKVTKYLYKPTGETASNKRYFIDKLYNIELEKLKLKENIHDQKSVYKKIMQTVENDVKKNIKVEYELQNIGWVDKHHFKNNKLTDIYSRKFMALITNIVSNWNAKHLVFSYYKTKGGVNMIHALFKMCGVKTEIYSGDISDGNRRKILKKFNAENNRYGEKIKVLLVTEAGAEGINVFETQHMHILESSTREMKIQQAIGRVVRYRSHMVEGRKPMPKNEQVVHIWRYWSVSGPEPIKVSRKIKDNDGLEKTIEQDITDKNTSDQILYEKGRYFINTIQSFYSLLKKASVTPYDKNQDSSGKLKDFRNLSIPPQLLDAYTISDKRYKNIEILEEKTSTLSLDDFKNITDGGDENSKKDEK